MRHPVVYKYWLFVCLLFYHVTSYYCRWTGSSLQPFLRLSGTRWYIWSFDHASKNSWKKMCGHPGSDRGQIKNTLASRGNKGSDWQVIYLWKLHLLIDCLITIYYTLPDFCWLIKIKIPKLICIFDYYLNGIFSWKLINI